MKAVCSFFNQVSWNRQVSMNPLVLDVWEKFSADKQWHDLVVQGIDGEVRKHRVGGIGHIFQSGEPSCAYVIRDL